jgi:hypothetical protein
MYNIGKVEITNNTKNGSPKIGLEVKVELIKMKIDPRLM